MAHIAHLEADDRLCVGVDVGDVVQCGPVGAVWRVVFRGGDGERAQFTLEPIDPHDVPLDAGSIPELPLPGR